MVVRMPTFDSPGRWGWLPNAAYLVYQDFRDATADGWFAARWRTGWSSTVVSRRVRLRGEREDGRNARQEHRGA